MESLETAYPLMIKIYIKIMVDVQTPVKTPPIQHIKGIENFVKMSMMMIATTQSNGGILATFAAIGLFFMGRLCSRTGVPVA